jgi:hypothetical protein
MLITNVALIKRKNLRMKTNTVLLYSLKALCYDMTKFFYNLRDFGFNLISSLLKNNKITNIHHLKCLMSIFFLFFSFPDNQKKKRLKNVFENVNIPTSSTSSYTYFPNNSIHVQNSV